MAVYCQHGEKLGIGDTAHVLRYVDQSNKNRILVLDWGMRIERGHGSTVALAPSGNYLAGEYVDDIVISHAHDDHIGGIIRFVAEHPEAHVWLTEETLQAAEIKLYSNLKNNERNEKKILAQGILPSEASFTRAQYEHFFDPSNKKIHVVAESTWINNTVTGLKMGFAPAGHVRGAIGLCLILPEGKALYFTGDICSHDLQRIKGVMLPSEEFLREYNFMDYQKRILITETTNGARPQDKSRHQIKSELLATILEVGQRGGVSLIHGFGFGRIADIVDFLVKADVRCHIDGIAQDFICMEMEDDLDELIARDMIVFFSPDNEKYQVSEYHREMAALGTDPCGTRPTVILAPSATLDGGYSVKHAKRILPGAQNALISVGHRFPGSLALHIAESKPGSMIPFEYRGETEYIPLNCGVYHFPLGAHDSQQALVERVRQFHPKVVIAHHGDHAAINGFRFAVENQIPNAPRVLYGAHMREQRI